MPRTSIFDVWRVRGLDKKIKGPFLKLKPDWICLDGYYCLPDYKYFLCGFVMNHKPDASEVNMFIQPLFNREIRMHLSYSDILKGEAGTIKVKGKKGTDIANEFVSKITAYIDEVKTRDSLEYFVNRIYERNSCRNTRIGYDLGLALILLKEHQKAVKYLEDVANSEWEIRVVPDEAKSAATLVSQIKSDPEKAFQTVRNYLTKNIEEIDGGF